MTEPIKRTTGGQPRTNTGTSKSKTQKSQASKNTQRSQQPKKREYAVGADGRKVDVTSVFDQIKKNSEQDQKDHDKFMQDMFGDVL